MMNPITNVINPPALRTLPLSGFQVRTAVLFVLLFLLPVLSAYSQQQEVLRHYSTDQGLSHDGVLCITRDKDGFMWFGTWDGLNKFDGHKFTVYKSYPGDSSSLTNNKFRNIVEDKAGYLWVKTYDHNVYRFDKNIGKFLAINTRNKIRNVIIDRIYPVRSGSTWLTTSGQGLFEVLFTSPTGSPSIYHYTKAAKGRSRLPSDSLNFLFEDSRKYIWVGTARGLARIKSRTPARGEGKPLPTAAEIISGQHSFTCAVQNGNNIYFGTQNGVLFSYDINSGKLKSRNVCPGIRINALHISRKRTLYAATSGKGLMIMDLQAESRAFSTLPAFSTIYSIYEDRGGRLWLEPESEGIVKYDPVRNTMKRFTQKKDSHAISPSSNYMVFEDSAGKLWTRFKGGGFGYYNSAEDKIDYFYNEPGAPDSQFSNIVTALYPDKTGILWLATIDGGVNKITFPANNFKHKLPVRQPVSKSQNEVRALFEDSRQRLWVGTKAGELKVLRNGINQENIFEGVKPSTIGKVYTIMEDKQGVIWLGTKGGGLLTATPLDPSGSRYRLRRFLADPDDPRSLSHNTVYSILQDKKGRIWVGTFGGGLNQAVNSATGIYFLNNKNSFKNYPAASNYIRHLCEDPFGKIWIATTRGLVIADIGDLDKKSGTFKIYTKIPGDPSSLGNNEVQFIFRDSRNAMWIGTFGGGVDKLISDVRSDARKFRAYTRHHGLPNDIILSITEDRLGYLWIATGKGLARFDPHSEVFQNYDAYDGLGQNQFSEAAAFRSSSGDLYFGCIAGYISFDPSRTLNRPIRANMALTNIQLYNTDIIPGAEGSPLSTSLNNTTHLELRYDQDFISIDYAVLDYRAAHKINYAYTLRGYDKGWHHVGNQRKATYTNLPPGNYEFVVRSLNKEMFSLLPEKSVRITILPPPWRTPWAYMAYFILAILILEATRRIVLAMLRLRNKVTIEQKMTELKLQFFTNISHELRTPLTLIVSPLAEISRNEPLSDRGKQYVDTIRRNADRMVRFINQLLDFRKAQSGKMRLNVSEVDVLSLLREVTGYFDGLAREKKIDLVLHSDVSELPAWLDPEKVDIVVYNLLSNAFKFSPEGSRISVEVTVQHAEGRFQIIIADQGPGVSEDKLHEIFDLYYEGDQSADNLKGTGIGLALSAELIHAHGGEIFAQNNPDGGMVFTLRLRLGREHLDDLDVNFAEGTTPEVLPQHSSAEINPITTPAPAEQPDQCSRHQVLLVEDNPELRTFIAGQLSAFYRVIEAGDGAEGLEIAQRSSPDLILSDVMMPGIDGIQMLDQLKNNPATSHIPVILLTAKSSLEAQIEGLRYGADFYVTKPFDIRYLMTLIENFLKRRASLVESLYTDEKRVVTLQPDEILITSRDEEFIKQVIKIIETSMEDSDFNIDTVAGSVGLGRTTFYKKMKSLTGLAPVEFVREMRLKRSKQLLDSGEYTISEVAYMTGFKSSGYFSTCFKEKYQLSPSAYLKSLKEESL